MCASERVAAWTQRRRRLLQINVILSFEARAQITRASGVRVKGS